MLSTLAMAPMTMQTDSSPSGRSVLQTINLQMCQIILKYFFEIFLHKFLPIFNLLKGFYFPNSK